MSDPLSDRDVADGIRRLVLDHGYAHFRLSSAPAAGSTGSASAGAGDVRIPAGSYFEVSLGARTFRVMVTLLKP